MGNEKEITVKLYLPEAIDIDGLYEYMVTIPSQKISTILEFINVMQKIDSGSESLISAVPFLTQVDEACCCELQRRIQPCDACGDQLGWGCGEYPVGHGNA